MLKKQAELLGSRLNDWNLLSSDTKITYVRHRDDEGATGGALLEAQAVLDEQLTGQRRDERVGDTEHLDFRRRVAFEHRVPFAGTQDADDEFFAERHAFLRADRAVAGVDGFEVFVFRQRSC